MRDKKLLFGIILFFTLIAVLFFLKWQEAKGRVTRDVLAVKSSALPAKSRDPLSGISTFTNRNEPAPNSSRQPKTFSGSLPPPNVPLTEIVGLLKAESDAGNYRASCRLGAELLRCDLYPLQLKEIAKLQKNLGSQEIGSEKYFNISKKIDSMQKYVSFDSPVCSGFTNPDKLEAWRFEFIAGLQGHIASKAQFAAAPPMNPIEFYKNLDAWAAYKEYAPTFLLTAANAGNNRAAWTLARAYAGETSLPGLGNLGGVELAKPDPYQAAVYAYSLITPESELSAQRSAARLIKEIEQKLTPEKIAAAKSDSAALRSTWAPLPAIANNTAVGNKERSTADIICDQP
jgi:hypothetical protein